MDTTLFLGMSNQAALRRRMDIIAHNVANMSTTAFKKERVVFQQHLMEAAGAQATQGGRISYVLDHGIIRNLDQGTMIATNNPLDVFIDGQAYLSVLNQAGETFYTRNGRMTLDNEGFLSLLSGERVLGVNGDTIQTTAADGTPTISENGGVIGDLGAIGQLRLVTFDNEQLMSREGGSLYSTTQAPQEVDDLTIARVVSNGYESSNVNAVEMMAEMIKVQRSYQSAQRNSNTINDLREDSLDRLARVQ